MKKFVPVVLCFLLIGCVTAVDESLPYTELPEIKLATAATLVASPSHPASYLSTEELPAGTTLQLLGRDQNAAWLLVAHENRLGWIPSFFSGTNVGTLETAIVVEPLSAHCTKYLGATNAINEEWQSTVEGSVIVVGSILRTDMNTDFSAASLSVEIDGRGTPIDSDYLHTPLTESSSVILFAYSLVNLREGDSIGFAVNDGGGDAPAFQAAFFSNSCAPDHVNLPIGTLKQSAAKAAPAQVASTAQPPVMQKADEVITHSDYIWQVRAANIDDAAAILVNGEIVAAGFYANRTRGNTDWIDITDQVNADKPNRVTLISLNGGEIGAWGFYLRRGETIIWGEEGDIGDEYAMNFAKTIEIAVDGTVNVLEPLLRSPSPPSDEWSVQVQDTDDLSVVLVNGQPVGGAYFCRNCDPRARPRAYAIDITQYLNSADENQLSMATWNAMGPFSYSFALEQNGDVVWQQDRSGTETDGIGQVFTETVVIAADGTVQSAQGSDVVASQPSVTGGGECNVIPAERCIVSDSFDSWAVGELPEFTSGGSWAQYSVADPTMLFHDGKFHLWFAGLSNQDANFSIGYAISLDGIDWDVRSSPVLYPGEAGSWEGHGVAAPNVIIKDGRFEMFYLGFQDPPRREWVSRIGLATSTDGIHWERNRNNPVFQPNINLRWMNQSVRDPSVLFFDNTYHMWFAGGNGDTMQIGYAESTDGVRWIVPVDQPVITLGSDSSWKSDWLMAPDVLYVNGMYHMWYAGRNTTGDNYYRIGHAISNDGLFWNDDVHNPVFGLGSADGFASGGLAHPTVAISGEGFHLWHSGSRAGASGAQLGYATSRDGVRWLR